MKNKIILSLALSTIIAQSTFATDATTSASTTTTENETVITNTVEVEAVPVSTTPIKPAVTIKEGDTTHVVVYGDTLNNIADSIGTTSSLLAKYNNISNPNKIFVGQTIVIPANSSIITTSENTVVANPDTISSASLDVYYADGTWTHEEFVEKFTDGVSKHAAITISTVNADGTPNLATVVPGFVDGETEYLKISFRSEGSTVKNLKERNYGVISAYQHNPEEEDKFVRNNGIRLVVETVTDENLIEKFNVDNSMPDNTLYMKIVRFLPLG